MRYLFIPSYKIFPRNRLGKINKKRLTQGLKMWSKGVYDVIIVSGGIFSPPEIQTIPAAELMKGWLIQKGVPSSKIITEVHSRDTFENVSFSLQLIKDPAPEITVVTHWQHALRFWITFKAYKMNIRVVPLWYWNGIKEFMLEWMALLVHIFDPTGKGIIARKNRKLRTYTVKGTVPGN